MATGSGRGNAFQIEAAEALGATQAIGGGIYHLPVRACDLEAIQHTVEQGYYTAMVGCPWSIVIIDECDTMSRPAQEALLRPLLDLERIVRHLLDAFGNRPAMFRFERDRLKDEEIEGPLDEIGELCHMPSLNFRAKR
jgi:hypothetical protein